QGNQGTAWTSSYSSIQPVKIFICPSRRDVKSVGARSDYATAHNGNSWASRPPDYLSILYGFDQYGAELGNPGPAYQKKGITIQNIVDGTSNTLFLAEKGMDPSTYMAAMSVYDNYWSWPTDCVSGGTDQGACLERVRCPFGFRQDRNGGYS